MIPYRLAAVASIGAVIGAAGRLSVSHVIPHNVLTIGSTTSGLPLDSVASQDFPWSTLTVNLVGALLIGFLASLPAIMESDVRRTFIVTGVLGGFTTFSALAVESVLLSNQPLQAIGYIFFTFAGGMLATHFGTWISSKRS